MLIACKTWEKKLMIKRLEHIETFFFRLIASAHSKRRENHGNLSIAETPLAPGG